MARGTHDFNVTISFKDGNQLKGRVDDTTIDQAIPTLMARAKEKGAKVKDFNVAWLDGEQIGHLIALAPPKTDESFSFGPPRQRTSKGNKK